MHSSISTLRTLILLSIIAAVTIASSNGVGEQQNRDRTGTPDGATTCAQCHNSGNFNPFMELTIRDAEGMEVEEYLPGETYELTYNVFTLAGPAASAFGFQATALLADLDNAGTFSPISSGMQIESVTTTSVAQRTVLEHSQPSMSGVWITEWTAPEEGGEVTFYYSGAAVNSNGGSGGDNSVTGQTTLPMAIVDDLGERALLDRARIYRQGDDLRIDSQEPMVADRVMITDLSGRAIRIFTAHDLSQPLPFSAPEGIYLLLIEDEGKADGSAFAW